MKRETSGSCTFQGTTEHSTDPLTQLGHVLGKKRAKYLSVSYYGVSHRNIICQHLNENCASNCGATGGNHIPAMTPEGKPILALLLVMLIAHKQSNHRAD